MATLNDDNKPMSKDEIESLFGKGVLQSKALPDSLLTEEQTLLISDCFDRLADCFDDILNDKTTTKATIAILGFARIDIQNAMDMLFSKPYQTTETTTNNA